LSTKKAMVATTHRESPFHECTSTLPPASSAPSTKLKMASMTLLREEDATGERVLTWSERTLARTPPRRR
jgi:hypothetical protein